MSRNQRMRVKDRSLVTPTDVVIPFYNRSGPGGATCPRSRLGQLGFRHQLLLMWSLLDREDVRVDCPVDGWIGGGPRKGEDPFRKGDAKCALYEVNAWTMVRLDAAAEFDRRIWSREGRGMIGRCEGRVSEQGPLGTARRRLETWISLFAEDGGGFGAADASWRSQLEGLSRCS